MLATLSGRWWVLLLSGICAVVAGIVSIMIPGIALSTLVMLFSLFAFVDGVGSLILGIRGEADGTYWWTMILLGIIAIVASIGAMAYPGLTLLVLLSFVAVSAIARGVFQIVASIKLCKMINDEWLLGLSGVLSIVFGGLLLARPKVGLAVMAMLLGFYMVAIGVMQIALSLRLRKMNKRLVGGDSPAAA
jgi:uncharacterized membrane protein HdeD (DUF308 family)